MGLEEAESLPAGSDQPWLCWHSLSRQRNGIGRTKTTMRMRGCIDNTTVTNRKQLTQLLCCRLLDEFALLSRSSPSQNGQRRVTCSGNTLCEGHGEEEDLEIHISLKTFDILDDDIDTTNNDITPACRLC